MSKQTAQAQTRLVSAAAMAHAITHDLQFHPPVKPRVLPELVQVPLPDGLLFEGGAERQVLRGKAVGILFPRLLPLLDGTRTATEILQALPDLPPQAITNALALLYTRGLLEDGGADEPDGERLPSEILGFLRRNLDATRMNRSAAQAGARLVNARVSVLASAMLAEHLCQALIRNGFGSVHAVGDPADALLAEPTFVVAVHSGAEPFEQLSILDKLCAAAGVPWLRCSITSTSGTIGPFFDRGETPCYECFLNHGHEATEGAAHLTPSILTFFVERLALEVTYMVSLVAPPHERDLCQIDLTTWTQRKYRLPPAPGCAACCPAAEPAGQDLPVSFIYEQAVSFPSRKYLVPKDHQMHYKASNMELSREVRSHPSASGEALPSPQALPPVPGSLLVPNVSANRPVDRDHLATLLTLTTGIRHAQPDTGKLQRWAPTGGNLGSAHAFILAHNVAALTPGCYSYEPGSHSLARVGDLFLPHEMAERIADICPNEPDIPDFLLVLTGAVGRVTNKYGIFGYRVVHLDAGVALAQAQAVCTSFGWTCRVSVWSPEDRIAELLHLDPITEQPTAVLAVYRGGKEPC